MKILVVAGRSGGHIFPALGFIDALKDKDKDKDTDILLVLPKSAIIDQIEKRGYKIRYISVSAIRLKIDSKNIGAIFKFLKGIFESVSIIFKFKPDIVVGFGSLVCIPLVLSAWAFRIKTLIHEQNVIPGQANRFLAKFSDRIAVSFMETKDYFKSPPEKIIFTGNPIRRELERLDKSKALDFFEFGYDKFTILVMGGSSGSHRINLGFFNALSMMSDKAKFQVIHLAGLNDYDLLKGKYKDSSINVRLFGFLNQMQYAYSASDLVVCRAGATTVTEIIKFSLPAIIVPYPFARRHQEANAKLLENRGSAIIIKDDALDGNALKENIEGLVNNPDRLKEMRANYNNISRPDKDNEKADPFLIDDFAAV